MKTDTAKFLPIAEKFFTAYDAHDVDGMLALCADAGQKLKEALASPH